MMSFRPEIEINRVVFFMSLAIIGSLSGYAGLWPKQADLFFSDTLLPGLTGTFGWFYILSVAFFLGFVLFLMVSSYGDIKLGPDDSTPDYSYGSWFAMLFSAGMGIGLLFFSVAEPMYHFQNPPLALGGSADAATESMQFTFFHWGFHAWAIYIVVGMSLAYFSFRKGLPLTIRSAFYPLFGKKVDGVLGDMLDVLAVCATMFGVATSLGLGVLQINAGIDFLTGIGVTIEIQLALIVIVTLMATVSVFSGLDKGVKRLSEANLVMALALLVFVFVAGPTIYLLDSFSENVGVYLSSVVHMTFWTDSEGLAGTWQGSWTLFYWGWWIAWSPFVGMFIARISRGRTIREFVASIMFVPTTLTFIWLTVFGETALFLDRTEEHQGQISAAMENGAELALFEMLSLMPWAGIVSLLATIVIITFFVTSSDSGSLVIDMLASGGNPDPPKWQRVFWAVVEGTVAAMLLVAGGLEALQAASISAALPFTVVLLLMCVSLFKALRLDKMGVRDVVADPVDD